MQRNESQPNNETQGKSADRWVLEPTGALTARRWSGRLERVWDRAASGDNQP